MRLGKTVWQRPALRLAMDATARSASDSVQAKPPEPLLARDPWRFKRCGVAGQMAMTRNDNGVRRSHVSATRKACHCTR